MTSSKKVDLITGLALMAASVWMYIESATFPSYGGGIGSGGYPALIAVGLFVLGGLMAGHSVYLYSIGHSIPEMKIPGLGRVVIYLVLILVYIWAMDYLGFIATSIIFLYISIMFFGYDKGWMRGVAFSVILTLASYFVFRHFFLVLLPTCRFF